MPTYTTPSIRNIALLGHGNCGKTSLAEAILRTAGAIHHTGQVEKGTTVSDFTEEEKLHHHSIYNSLLNCTYSDSQIHLIDTPGFPDFVGQAYCALAAVETAAVVINAASGIEAMTRKLMEEAGKRKLCRMIIINKIDAENVDLPDLVAQIQDTFGKECLPINLPANGGKSVVDCFFNPAGESDFGSVKEAHTALVEQVVEVDEKLMSLYLEQGESLNPDQLHAPFEQALREGHLVPICFVSARGHLEFEKSVGIKELLDIFVKLAPNPLEGNPRPFVRGADLQNELHAEPDAAKHILAHVFAVRIDPFMGKICYVRLHQGSITPNSQLYIDDPKQGEAKKPFKVGHIFKLQGKDHSEIATVIPGDLAAIVKVEEIHRDAVLHDSHDEDNIHYKPEKFPEPMFGNAIVTQAHGDEKKLADALTKMIEEDPTFKVVRDASTHQTVIYGMGELHLRVAMEKLRNRYHVPVGTQPVKISYRETIQDKAEGHHRHKKQTGGAGQFGEVYLRIEPLERGKGFEFVNDIFGGTIPGQYIPAIEKGVRQVLETGAVAGYPMQDIRVSVYDGKHHPVDSKEVAFVAAGKRAFIEAIHKARPTLLEPIVKMEITVPAKHMGDINGDLSGKRGRIINTDILSGDQAIIRAYAPLSEITNYQSQLKSVTAGQGSYTMELSHYDPMPPQVQQQIVAQYKPHPEED